MNYKILIAALLAAFVVQAEESPLPVPLDWTVRTRNSPDPLCLAGADTSLTEAGTPNLTIKCPGYTGGSTFISQDFDATPFRSQRVRFSAEIKAENVSDAGVRIPINDGRAGGSIGLVIVPSQPGVNVVPLIRAFAPVPPVGGTSDWRRGEIVVDVPNGSVVMSVLFMHQGTGQVWLRNPAFEAVGLDVPVTHRSEQQGPNLDLAY